MRIGIVGGGQLARMLALAARPLGIDCVVLDRDPACSASHVAKQITAPYDDVDSLRKLAAHCDVITYEFENIPVGPLRALSDSIPVRPSIEALAAAQDRLAEKTLFRELQIDTAEFVAVDSLETLKAALGAIGVPAVLKTRRMGYDGKGQFILRRIEDADEAWRAVGGRPSILEAFVEFDRELSVVAVRGRDGLFATYPLTCGSHRDGILRETIAPAPNAAADAQREATRSANALMDRFDYVGVLALELFDCGGRLLANEFAPRVHNTGHWTIEGTACSQFENHVRAVLDFPLGATHCARPAGMLNLIGGTPPLAELLALPGAHVHLYQKSPRPHRKIGHVTTIADSYESLDGAMATLRRRIEP